MKILFFGGQKSGKSLNATNKALELSQNKTPFYIATYDNSFGDSSMEDRVNKHIIQRDKNFITIEEPKNLTKIIKENETYLIDCISMWIFNNLDKNEDILKEQLSNICTINSNIIFVLNDVSCGVIPLDNQSRRFVDLSGIIGQELVKLCDEVYETKYGIAKRLK